MQGVATYHPSTLGPLINAINVEVAKHKGKKKAISDFPPRRVLLFGGVVERDGGSKGLCMSWVRVFTPFLPGRVAHRVSPRLLGVFACAKGMDESKSAPGFLARGTEVVFFFGQCLLILRRLVYRRVLGLFFLDGVRWKVDASGRRSFCFGSFWELVTVATGFLSALAGHR